MNLSLILADASLFMSEHFDSLTSFTFFVGCMAMMAASVFFFLEMGSVDKKWRTSLLVSGIITFIAFVHYYYMRDYYLATGDSPIAFRYVDWTLDRSADVRGVLPHHQESRWYHGPHVEAHLCFCHHVGHRLLG